MSRDGRARIGADIGGTFTDLVLDQGDRRFLTKVLTTHDAPEIALLEGIDELLRQAQIAPGDVDLLVHGTTLATNALIERRGARTGLLTTEGFRDVLVLGSESRFDQYDLTMDKPPALVPRRLRLTVGERVAADGAVLCPLSDIEVERAAAFFETEAVESIAIAFLHSYANPAHEQAAAAILRRVLPEVTLSLSSEVSPEIREYERFSTTTANAYVQPIVAGYLSRLKISLQQRGFACPLFLMLSSGGLTTVETAMRFPVRLVESGPAGGAIFAAGIAAERGIDRMLALDIGGTTAKICFIDQGRPQSANSFEVARMHRFRKGSGLPLRIPVVEMVEIGTGGGSIAKLDSIGRTIVGPESAGSEPGPACYGRGGRSPTVTDADLLLGRIDPKSFAGGLVTLDPEHAALSLSGLIDASGDPQIAALGVSEIADETIASAARVHAVELGFDVQKRTLLAFGGAAPLHAARVAEKLGIAQVVIPPGAGVGSAIGFLLAPIAYDILRSGPQILGRMHYMAVNRLLAEMEVEATGVVSQGAPRTGHRVTRTAYARYRGQGYEIAVKVPNGNLDEAAEKTLRDNFESAYREHYGATMPDLAIEILTWRVGVSTTAAPVSVRPPVGLTRLIHPTERRPVRDPASGKILPYGLIRRDALSPGDRIIGPALVIESETTTVVTPAFDLTVDGGGALVLDRRFDQWRDADSRFPNVS